MYRIQACNEYWCSIDVQVGSTFWSCQRCWAWMPIMWKLRWMKSYERVPVSTASWTASSSQSTYLLALTSFHPKIVIHNERLNYLTVFKKYQLTRFHLQRYYLDRMAEEINEALQESGKLALSDLGSRFSIASDFLQEVKPKIQSILSTFFSTSNCVIMLLML